MQILPPVLQCVFVIELCLAAKDFGPLDCLPGMPLALYDFAFLDAAVFCKLQPPLRATLLEGVLVVINWLRELLNGYGLGICQVRCHCLALRNVAMNYVRVLSRALVKLHDRVVCNTVCDMHERGTPGHACTQVEDFEASHAVQGALLRRTAQLAKLQILLVRLLASEEQPSLPHPPLCVAPGAALAARRRGVDAWVGVDDDEGSQAEEGEAPAPNASKQQLRALQVYRRALPCGQQRPCRGLVGVAGGSVAKAQCSARHWTIRAGIRCGLCSPRRQSCCGGCREPWRAHKARSLRLELYISLPTCWCPSSARS